MTEAKWLECTDPGLMLEYLRGKSSERKLRLFGCACCRRVWHVLTDDRSQRAVEMAERIADGSVEKDSQSVRKAAWRVEKGAARNATRVASRAAAKALERKIEDLIDSIGRNVAEAWAWHAARLADPDYTDPTKADEAWDNACSAECSSQCRLLRCIFGNPFHSLSLDSMWLRWHDGLLVSMARQMYEARDFTDMPILADALEEAGCMDQDILTHCRSEGEHVRGCWVIDLVLGES